MKISFFYSVNQQPVIVLGNQKSGTTVIASLLAKAAKKTIIIDPFYRIKNQIELRRALLAGEITFESFVRSHKYYFSWDIIKEPNFIYYLNDIVRVFPKAKFIFIARDPRDNIRSILNRLNLPGDLEALSSDSVASIPDGWKLILTGKYPTVEGNNYIEKLAYRWQLCAQIFLNRKVPIELIKYEDFSKDKHNTIKQLCKQVGLEPIVNLEDFVDIQYQPRGDRDISWENFFDVRNLDTIERICSDTMVELGYRPQRNE